MGAPIAYDGSGHARAKSGKTDGGLDLFYPGPAGDALRVSKQGVHLISTALDGRVAWRAIADGPIGPMAASHAGVAVLVGRSLAWFGDQPSS